MSGDLVTGSDGLARCSWAPGTPELCDYHDSEWGMPVLDDGALFERICLESFQCGLSWLTVLRKREAFRAAFAGFRIEAVARFGETDVERLLADAGIVRNRGKITASIENARRALEAIEECGSLASLIWRFAPEPAAAPRSFAELATVTPESEALARELRAARFSLSRPDHGLRPDARLRADQRPPRRLPRP